jgi:ribonuclease HI
LGGILAQPTKIQIYSDGASRGNPGPSAIAYTIYDEQNNLIDQASKYIGRATNSEAEYDALIWAMDVACSYCRNEVRFHSDSEFMINQVNGVYRVHKENMRMRLEKVNIKKSLFKQSDFVHVGRNNAKMQLVDKLANQALAKEGF